MTTIKALKTLAAVIIGGDTAPSDIAGNTIPEVINYLAENYPNGSVIGTVEELDITTVAGSTFGATKITVKPTLTSGNSYVYKTSPSTIGVPDYHEVPTGVTAWDGKSEIESEDGYHIGIYELNSDGKVVKYGEGVINVNLG
jgi:hypothetical protein